LPITQGSIALPLPSYSLKVVEKYVGYKRTLDEVAGDWAMAKYIEAVETEDPDVRNGLMAQILDYNREDLEATWAVLKWLKAK
jgi:predicted RecB family nuclease